MKNLVNQNCPMSNATKFVGDFWNILIIQSISKGEVRFSQIKKEVIGITSAVLTNRLKKLVEENLVDRKYFATIPPRVEYTLTQKGKDMAGIVEGIKKFSDTWYC